MSRIYNKEKWLGKIKPTANKGQEIVTTLTNLCKRIGEQGVRVKIIFISAVKDKKMWRAMIPSKEEQEEEKKKNNGLFIQFIYCLDIYKKSG